MHVHAKMQSGEYMTSKNTFIVLPQNLQHLNIVWIFESKENFLQVFVPFQNMIVWPFTFLGIIFLKVGFQNPHLKNPALAEEGV